MMTYVLIFLYTALIITLFSLIFQAALRGLTKLFSYRTANMIGVVILILFVTGMVAFGALSNPFWMRVYVLAAFSHLPVTITMIRRNRL